MPRSCPAPAHVLGLWPSASLGRWCSDDNSWHSTLMVTPGLLSLTMTPGTVHSPLLPTPHTGMVFPFRHRREVWVAQGGDSQPVSLVATWLWPSRKKAPYSFTHDPRKCRNSRLLHPQWLLLSPWWLLPCHPAGLWGSSWHSLPLETVGQRLPKHSSGLWGQ